MTLASLPRALESSEEEPGLTLPSDLVPAYHTSDKGLGDHSTVPSLPQACGFTCGVKGLKEVSDVLCLWELTLQCQQQEPRLVGRTCTCTPTEKHYSGVSPA